MGSQQLLLIILGVIIIAIGVAVGLTLFKSHSSDADRNQIITQIMSLSLKAQIYYRKPVSLGGGGGSFQNFGLTSLDTGDASGSYSVRHVLPRGTSYVAGGSVPIHPPASTIYIVGCGKEIGNNETDPVKAYAAVSQDSIAVVILN
jgi:hypothetical protein